MLRVAATDELALLIPDAETVLTTDDDAATLADSAGDTLLQIENDAIDGVAATLPPSVDDGDTLAVELSDADTKTDGVITHDDDATTDALASDDAVP